MSFVKKPKHGFVLGKFLPPHNGHIFLCDFAQNYCEELTILVCSLQNEPIPGKLRYEWMKELFPKCNVIWCNEVLPQEPKDENDLEFWKIWKYTVEVYTGRKFDVVFASENYGHRLAKELSAEFVPCDIKRIAQKCSGTAVRSDVKEMWDYLPNIVKPYFVKRICMFGPESSGKSTLANQLAKYYKTIVAPEYGRTYTETFGADVNSEDMRNIVSGHLASVRAAKKLSNYILIEDTDPVMSGIWAELLTGNRDDWFSNFRDYPDLYILCKNDIPWVDDGTRYFKEENDRRDFFKRCQKELDDRGVSYVVVSGDEETRLKLAVEAINK